MFKIRPVSTGVKFEPVKELEVEIGKSEHVEETNVRTFH